MYQIVHAETDGSDTILVSTDGRRMHILRYAGRAPLTAGGYRIIASKADIIILDPVILHKGSFPRWRRVIPQETVRLYDKLSFNRKKSDRFCDSVYQLNRLGFCIDHKYLEALAIADAVWTATAIALLCIPFIAGKTLREAGKPA